MSLYLLDSNFFIQAHRAYYPLDVVTSFWEKVNELAIIGSIKSIDKVKKELYDNSSHEDELKHWCQEHLPEDFFIDSSNSIGNYIKIVEWANSKSTHYKPRAIAEFLEADLADPWLVAASIGQEITIVTYEKSEPEGKKRIKIPEACDAFGVRYINTVEMLRELGQKV